MHILVINGPNMNLLGVRQPEIYGRTTYEELTAMIQDEAKRLGVKVSCFQSNHEGDLIDVIQQAYYDKMDGIIINPAAYTHTSVALMDKKIVVKAGEDFRHVSYIRAACVATIRGHGLDGYLEALRLLVSREKKE